jgi:membrane-associated phospholipid phosphatase
MIRRKILTAAGLSVLFIVVYGACNQITAIRSDVGVFFFAWELRIPLVPLFIIPYMSIDLFFVGAPFLCTSEQELRTFAKRVAWGILIAGACFLAMPLTIAFPTPHVEGPLGAVFAFLHGFDRPYNLFPSLHIILRTFLAHTYVRHTRGMTRLAVRVWFSLIGFSTVFTHQHHVMDVAGGFVVAIALFYAIPEERGKTGMVPNRRIGVYYATLAMACLLGAYLLQPWGLLLLWPATSLLLVTMGYWHWGPSIFRKREGQIPFSARVLLFPYFLGQHIYLRSYDRTCNRWDEVLPDLLLGRVLRPSEAEEAVEQGVAAVVDLTAEFEEAPAFRALPYCSPQTLDLTAPTPEGIREAVDFIAQHIPHGKVYVHCKIGYSRSAAIVGAYLIQSGKATDVEQAVALIRAARPSLILRPEARQALVGFAAESGPEQTLSASEGAQESNRT